MTSIFHSGLSKDISLLLNDPDDFNVIIQVGENEDIKEFRAHSIILRARSPYFKSALATKWITIKDNMIMYKKPNITPTVFDMILRYIYTGELDLTNYLGENILGLLVASDELLIEELFNHVQDYLIEKQTTWVQKNFVLVLHTVFEITNCKKLQDHCLESICSDPQSFVTSKNFPLLDKEILYGLLKRDDFLEEEVVIWDCLIKWGIEQTPSLGKNNNDRTKWNNTNYQALKKTLDQFIPYIRFMEISPADYFDKIRPYRTIIPNHICDEVEEFYFKGTLPKIITASPRIRKIKIKSNLIKPKLASIIAGWIERTNEKNLSRKYNFDLLYRGSRDGINTNTFRIKCNDQGPCLILIKNQKLEKIYGGYNPLSFTNVDGQYSTTESFIFSFENNEDILNMKISRVRLNCANHAIYGNYSDGFNFGNVLRMSGQTIYFGGSSCFDNIGNVLNLNTSFIPVEIEVFKIITL
ncbi:hypothetical protein C1645_820294 [Glomus cerebriforme]|uniref:BTB/POZ domain-containing protein n=1 Tax=Glomus cerebriforme TaxID=658196 RepID=A0A397T8T5_9GLOM|nr:hypothetical protein C1645_820294 [Glomus cerebriforme]